jgi:protein-disulfide isomerase
MKNPWIAVLLVVVVVFGGAIMLSQSAAEENNIGVTIESRIKGNPDAPFTMAEYSDFECPACAAYQPVVNSILDQFDDLVNLEYRHFPLPMHRHARPAAVAAEAAGQQGKFFEFHDILFDRQSEWASAAVPTAFFVQYAEELELDVELFRRHLKSSIIADYVAEQFNVGREKGISSTPTFFVNDQQIVMNQGDTFEDFVTRVVAIIDPSAVPENNNPEAAEGGVKFGL